MTANIIPVATGEAWIGYGVRSFRSVIGEMIDEAREQLVLTVYVLTNRGLVNKITEALERGVAVTIYLYDNGGKNPMNDATRDIFRLQEEFSYLEVNSVKNRVLHAKIIVADGRRVLVGSANLTYNALANNYELGFLVEDPAIASKVLSLVRKVGE
ncbi:MAG: endonuclease [Desulfuromonas sp. SDB]|nr:MAG: endonuclease [Desulfuromonas sp. SDB]